MNPQSQKALDDVKKQSRSHEHCCEVDAANKALNAGDNVRGAKMGPVTSNEKGTILGALFILSRVLKSLGIE